VREMIIHEEIPVGCKKNRTSQGLWTDELRKKGKAPQRPASYGEKLRKPHEEKKGVGRKLEGWDVRKGGGKIHVWVHVRRPPVRELSKAILPGKEERSLSENGGGAKKRGKN